MFSDLFERAWLAAIETEPEFENLAFSLVERPEQPSDLLGQQCRGRDFERRVGTTVFDDVTEFGITVLPERFGQ